MAVASPVVPMSSPSAHIPSKPPPPRPKLPPSAEASAERRGFAPNAYTDPSTRRPSAGIPPPSRALQLLRETRPPPPRRQSDFAPQVPRGTSPLPSIDGSGANVATASSPQFRSPFAGKPPPPRTQPPMATIAAARRHSTGSMYKNSTSDPLKRPPPPRGPPPLPGGSVPVATDLVAVPRSLRDNLRRRSGDFRAPPPGRPPLGRRPSGPPPGAPSIPDVTTYSPNMQPTERQQNVAGMGSRTGALESNTTAMPPTSSDPNASHHVSFSAYPRPSTDKEDEDVTNNDTKEARNGNSKENGAPSIALTSTTPFPQLQRRRSSLSGAPGRPPPPRSLGTSPENSADQIRRYSISNELSNGAGNFSRRMSAVDAPKATTAASSQTQGANAPLQTRQDSTEGTLLCNSTSGSVGEESQLPSTTAEGRATLLWYNMGVTRQKNRDAVGAIECYKRAASEGHAKAQHNLAAIYEKGAPGVAKDEKEAVRLFQLAADQELAESCYSLAMHFKFGLGVEQDDSRCVHYLEKASENGLGKAMFNLGLMYEKRRGISPEAPEADLLEATRVCYQAAAEAGVTKAAVNLGVLYLTGRISGREPAEALEWFKLAADQGDMSGVWNLSLCYERGVGVPRDPIAAQALQYQCREREREQRTANGEASGAGSTAEGSRRCSSSSSAMDPTVAPQATTRVSGVGGVGESKTYDEIVKKPRRKSSHVLGITPPPPSGPPPPRESSDGDRKIEVVAATSESKPVTGETGSITGNNKPTSVEGSANNRRSSGEDGNVVPGHQDHIPLRAEPSGSPPQRERKDSLLLKPTPAAIARVKAAVERRRAMGAAVARAVAVPSKG